MNSREMFTQMTNDKQTSKHKLGKPNEQMHGRKCRRTLAAQIAKKSNGKDHID